MALGPKEIGRRIREVREQVGVEVSQIAGALGVDERTVLKLEDGELRSIPGALKAKIKCCLLAVDGPSP